MVIFDDEDRKRFYANTVRIQENLLAEWIAEIESAELKGGVTGLALAVLEDFCVRTELGQPQSELTLRWLTKSLRRIIAGEDAVSVLHLQKRPRHRPVESGIRGFEIAWWVRIAIDRGYGVVEAKGMAADRFGRDVTMINRYIARHRSTIDGVPADPKWADRFEALGKPLPSIKERQS